MDSSTMFPGFGKQLSAVLIALGSDLILDPVWTLKHANGKVFLDIVWTKTKTPATDVKDKASNCVTTQKQLDTEQVDQNPVEIQRSKTSAKTANVCTTKKRKLKSPSTRKRDRLRLEKWLSKKRSDSNNGCKPLIDSAHPSSTGSTGCVINSALDIPAVSSSSISHVGETETQLPVNSSSSGYSDGDDVDCDSQVETQKTSSPECELSDSESQLSTELGARPEIPSHCKSQKPSFNSDVNTDDLDPHCFNLDCSIRQSELGCKLLRCSRCASALYCSKTCQVKHWRLHRPNCGKL